MTDFEQHLARQPLAAPSLELDDRIARAFAAAGRASFARRLEPWWWFAALLSLGTATLLVFVAPPPPSSPAAPVEIRFEPNDALRRLLLEPPSSARPLPHPQVRIQSS